MGSELHLFIIWNRALAKAGTILEDMRSNFEIRRVFEMHWSEKHFSDNMSRFYGQKLPRDSFKETHCGRGPFLLVVVRDNDPRYGLRETSRGPLEVNTRCFDAKERYRKITDGGHRIHGTNTPAETAHDLVLLLRQTPGEFEESHATPWDGNVEIYDRDLAGAGGWLTLNELLHTLNASIDYAVLRNFEDFPDNATMEGHGDVDLLCANTQEMAYIANASPLFQEPYRVLHQAMVGGKPILFDFRAVGDNYYDPVWAKDMIDRRVFSPKGFYHLGADDHFHSLLYHAAVHKPSIAPDYVTRLIELSRGKADLDRKAFADPSALRAVIDRFFSRSKYRFVEPDDLSVYFNAPFARIPKLSVNRVFTSSRSLGAALRTLFEQTEDCSTASSELQDSAFRLPSLTRFFSPTHGMLIEAIGLPSNSRVLEVGAETGALTRFLGERFRQVTALEPNADLRRTVTVRCRDLKSVDVRPVPLDVFDGAGEFDAAIAQIGSNGLKAAVPRLNLALKKTGVLLLGIAGDSVTVLRDEAVAQLKAQGFTSFRFLYPFPGLTLPRVVFSDEAIRSARKAYGYWAAFAQTDSPGAAPIGEMEAAAISAEGRLDSIAKNCYILATRDDAAMPALSWHVWAVSADSRHPSLRATTLVQRDHELLSVRKRGTPSGSGVFQFLPDSDCPLFEGHTEAAALMHALKNGAMDQFLTLLKMHAQSLVREFAFERGSDYPCLLVEGDVLLRGAALDAIPQNTIIENNQYRLFDLEWQAAIPLPLSYVLLRGLTVFFQKADTAAICSKFRLEQYGLPAEPDALTLAVCFLNTLALFRPMESRSVQHVVSFEQRFRSFAENGQVPASDASMFELYHQAIGFHSEGRYEESERTLGILKTAYPDAPEPLRLASTLTPVLAQ
ncbi:MAG TPA: hypothetical protein VE422_04750 [Terriglobia bacterium]|nr:hypothetical protein [Terriglobia bacterium]